MEWKERAVLKPKKKLNDLGPYNYPKKMEASLSRDRMWNQAQAIPIHIWDKDKVELIFPFVEVDF